MTEFSDIPEQPYDWQHVPKYRGANRVTRNPPLAPKARMPSARGARGSSKLLPKLLPKVAGQSPNDDGYWHMVVATALLLFVLYVAAHNEIGIWAKILFWSPAAPVQVQTGPA